MEKRRLQQIIEDVADPDPLNCQFIGSSCLTSRNEPALIIEERWFCGEGEDTPTSHLIVLHDWVEMLRGVCGLTIRNSVDDFTPIERDSDASREIASHILTGVALELGIIKSERAASRSSEHPLVGVPCILKGHLALPFGVFDNIWPSDPDAGRFAEEKHFSLLILLYKPSWKDREQMVVELATEDVTPKPDKFTAFWSQSKLESPLKFALEKVHQPFKTELAPIQRDTKHSRRAFQTILSHLDKKLDEKRWPKPERKDPEVATV